MLITVLVWLESMGFVANMVSLVLYLMTVMYFNIPGASTTITNFMGTTFLLSIVGGLISDTLMTRLNTALLFGAVEVMVSLSHHIIYMHV